MMYDGALARSAGFGAAQRSVKPRREAEEIIQEGLALRGRRRVHYRGPIQLA